MSNVLGESIKKYRLIKGLTQKELSEKIEISRSFMSQIESGISKPSKDNLQKIADVLDVSLSDLLKENPPSPLEELISLLIELTEKEIINWEIDYVGDGSDNFYLITRINEISYYLEFRPYEDKNSPNNEISFDEYHYKPKNEKEYQLFKKLYESIMVFHNVNDGIYKSINDLKDLLNKK